MATLALLATGVGWGGGAAGATEPTPPRRFVGPHHLEATPRRRIQARLDGVVGAPRLQGTRWLLYAPAPPDAHGQRVTRWDFLVLEAEGKPSRRLVRDLPEGSALARPLRHLDWRPPRPVAELPYRYEVEVVLDEVALRPGPAPTPVPPLDEASRRQSLSATGRYDWKTPTFSAWVERVGLVRGQEERDLDFAYRVLAHLHDHFTYRFPPRRLDRLATEVVEEGASDCGGLGVLFASVLRAHGVPARLVVGRWVLPDRPEDPQFHVRAEFWAHEIGWVPVDASGAVTWANAPDTAFGTNPARFLTMHLEPDLVVPTGLFGDQRLPWMQSPAWWVQGSGSLDGAHDAARWKVTEESLAPAAAPR